MKKVFILVVIFFSFCSFGQTEFDDVIDSFEDFAELSREQIYIHLNKSTYISNEAIWFKSYVFSRDNRELSGQTSNLYCVLLDPKDSVVREKMIMSVNGIGQSYFETDSSFVQGEYTLKMYTNWSKNFENEYTHYETKFTIINPDKEAVIKPVSVSNKVDLQILPESGHLLANIKNSLGIIAKDSIGLGIGNLKVNVLENGTSIKQLQLNAFGIGSIELVPNVQSDYKIEFFYNNKKQQVDFPTIELRGVVLNVEMVNSGVTVKVSTNDETLNNLENELYKLTLHNSVDIKSYDFLIQDKKTQLFNFKNQELFSGINIITLFNSDAEPIAERLYFNYEGLELGEMDTPITSKMKDSILVRIPFGNADASKFQSLSISVLPSKTKSYNHHNSIISSVLLQPYLRNPVQNASYYFKNIDNKKVKDLDELLLTEGWSSYNWSTIFNNPPEYIYDFEVGVSYNLNSNSDETAAYFIYPNFNTKTEILTLEAKGSLKKKGFFPLFNEDLRIGKLGKNKQLESSNLVVQFFPSKIPFLQSKRKPFTSQISYQDSNGGMAYYSLNKLDKIQELEEVTVTKKKEYTKIEKLKNARPSTFIEFDKKKRRFYRTFAQFISSYGFYVEETPSDEETGYSIFRIFNNLPTSINASQIPTIFLDDVLLIDYNILNNYSMRNVDYVEVNKSGVGEGIRGGGGVIRIYNHPFKPDVAYIKKESYTSYSIPVVFDKPKTFYAPKYGSYETNFFKEYGVIDWKPNVKVINNFIELKVVNHNQPIKLFVEGIVNNSQLVSKEVTLED
ncbi:hypothetical protein [Winogradskyella sp. PE311]|uniref:hypothetical protein n=1 Tax=Winogradskyella sp. PE311 TaxID=3366943 RepID=UPI00397F905C